MNEEKFYRIAKLLFFGTLDESFAFEKAADLLVCPDSRLLPEIHAHLDCYYRKPQRKKRIIEGHLSLPQKTNLSFWKEFKKHSDRDSFLPLLYKWVGKFTDKEVADVFKVSQGAIFTRYNKALLELGDYLMKGGAQ